MEPTVFCNRAFAAAACHLYNISKHQLLLLLLLLRHSHQLMLNHVTVVVVADALDFLSAFGAVVVEVPL